MKILDSIGKTITPEKTCEWQIIVDKHNAKEVQKMVLGCVPGRRIPLRFSDTHHTKDPDEFDQTVFAIFTHIKKDLYSLFEIVYDWNLGVFRAYEDEFELGEITGRRLEEMRRESNE